MTARPQIRFNAFDMNCVAHQSPGLWRHPDDQAWRYKDIDYWTHLARTAERGVFDGIFIADVLGTYDVYGGNDLLSKYDLDEPIGNVQSNAIQSTVAAFQEETDDGRVWTVRDIAKLGALCGLGATYVGSPTTVADTLERIVEETGVDGFNLAYAITPGTFEDVVEYIVPELQRRGVYPTEYAPGTLRNKLFGAGDRLPDGHHGSLFRVGGPLSTIDDYTGTGRPVPAALQLG